MRFGPEYFLLVKHLTRVMWSEAVCLKTSELGRPGRKPHLSLMDFSGLQMGAPNQIRVVNWVSWHFLFFVHIHSKIYTMLVQQSQVQGCHWTYKIILFEHALPQIYFHGENSVGIRTLEYAFLSKARQSRTEKKKI